MRCAGPTTELGLKLADVPAGSPLALKLTSPPKPARRSRLDCNWLLPPQRRSAEAGDAAGEKSGGGGEIKEDPADDGIDGLPGWCGS